MNIENSFRKHGQLISIKAFCLKQNISEIRDPNGLILFLKVVRFFGLKLKISISTELIVFSFQGKLHIEPGMVLGYFVFIFQP